MYFLWVSYHDDIVCLFRHDVVFLQEHFRPAVPQKCGDIGAGCAPGYRIARRSMRPLARAMERSRQLAKMLQTYPAVLNVRGSIQPEHKDLVRICGGSY